MFEPIVGIGPVEGDGIFCFYVSERFKDKGVIADTEIMAALLVHAGNEKASVLVELEAAAEFVGNATSGVLRSVCGGMENPAVCSQVCA